MALRLIDGFDHYVTADIEKKWDENTFGVIHSTNGRRGGRCLRWASGAAANFVIKTFDAQATWIVGFAVRIESTPGSVGAIVKFQDSTSTQCDLRINTDRTLSVTRAGTAVTNGTSVFTMSLNTYYYIEFKATIADSIGAGTCKVRVNGVDVITVATGQDLKATANASANRVAFGSGSITATPPIEFDDLYVCDGTGSTNNDFLGDCRVDTLLPNADGNYIQFTPSTGSDHYALVDEASPNTSDYNSGLTVGDRDSYAFGNLAALASQTVHGVQVNAAVMKDDAGAKSAGTMARSSSTNADGTGVALGTSQVYVSQVYETDPNGAIAWTESAVNAAEFGVKVTA